MLSNNVGVAEGSGEPELWCCPIMWVWQKEVESLSFGVVHNVGVAEGSGEPELWCCPIMWVWQKEVESLSFGVVQ